MTALSHETSPQVELKHNTQLTPEQLSLVTATNATSDAAETFKHALLAYKVHTAIKLRDEFLNKTIVEDTAIRTFLDNAWLIYSPVFRRATAPMIAEAYITAFRETQAGEVPIQLVYKLADEHAMRVGTYFHETSSEALLQGFNLYVNRQVPKRAALERVLDAYGLTPRQMKGFTSAAALQPIKVESSIPRALKAKSKQYIGKALAQRLKIFTGQEAHNLDEQAHQVAWMYLVEHQRMPQETQKIWLTANDEKVCEVCGPMHRKRVAVTDRFTMPNGDKLYVPGAHTNCRCRVSLWANPFTVVQGEVKKSDWEPKLHPRGGNPENRGQFSRKPPVREAEPVSEGLASIMRQVEQARHKAQEAKAAEPVVKPKLEIGQGKPKLDIAPTVAPPTVKPKLDIAPAPPKDKPKLTIAQPVEEPVDKPKLVIGGTQPKLEIAKPALDIDYEGLERDVTERQTAYQTIEMGPVRDRPTRQITDMYGKPVPGYVVSTGSPMMDYQNQAMLTDNDPVRLLTHGLTDDWRQREITMAHDQAVTEKFYEIRDTFDQFYDTADEETYIELSDPTQYYNEDGSVEDVMTSAAIPLSTAQEVVERMVWNNPAYGKAYEDLMLPEYELTWVDEDGEVVGEETLNTLEMAQHLGLDADDYRPVVMRLDEGYASAYQEDDDFWKAPGTYTVVNHRYKVLHLPNGSQVPYMEVELRPQVADGPERYEKLRD